MSLRDQIHADVWKVFFNQRGLSQTKTINGKEVRVIEDSDQLLKYRQQGICQGTLLLYIPEDGELGLGYRPEAGDVLMYGSRKYLVELADCTGGVIKLILCQERGY